LIDHGFTAIGNELPIDLSVVFYQCDFLLSPNDSYINKSHGTKNNQLPSQMDAGVAVTWW
jgi:hypothetical protein